MGSQIPLTNSARVIRGAPSIARCLMGRLEPQPAREQYLVVYGPPKAPPTVYATAYRESEREVFVKACMSRHPEAEDNAVRVVRGCDLDPQNVAQSGDVG